MRRWLIGTLCIFLLASASAFAQVGTTAQPAEPDYYPAPEDFDRTGFYVGLAGTYALEFFDDGSDEFRKLSRDSRIKTESKNSWAVNGRLGYRLHRYIATELMVDWYEDFVLERNDGATLGRLEGLQVLPAVKGYFLTGRYQPYAFGAIGFGHMQLKCSLNCNLEERSNDLTAFVARFGPGIDVYVVRNVLLNVEAHYVYPTGDLEDFPLVAFTFGGQFRF